MRIEQHSQQVLLHVADLGGVVVQALHDKLDVAAVQLQKPGADYFMGKVTASDPGGFPFGADSFHHQFHDLVQVFPAGGKLPAQVVILDVLQNQIPITFHLSERHRIPSFSFRQLRCCWLPEENRIGI